MARVPRAEHPTFPGTICLCAQIHGQLLPTRVWSLTWQTQGTTLREMLACKPAMGLFSIQLSHPHGKASGPDAVATSCGKEFHSLNSHWVHQYSLTFLTLNFHGGPTLQEPITLHKKSGATTAIKRSLPLCCPQSLISSWIRAGSVRSSPLDKYNPASISGRLPRRKARL